jgi:hypothetical protein
MIDQHFAGRFAVFWRRGRSAASNELLQWRTPRRLFAAALIAIVVVALAVRWVRTPRGLPYVHHWDEVYITNPPVAMLKTGSFNPTHFYYGTFYLYVQAAVDALHFLRLQQTEQDKFEEVRSVQQLRFGEDGWIWWVSHPSFYLANRRVTVVFGAATALLLALYARRLMGPAAALLSAAAIAVSAAHIEHSSYATTDIPALFLVLLSAVLAGFYVERRRFGVLFASAIVAGLATATKYNALVAILAPATALALSWSRLERRERLRGCLAVAFLPVLAFFAAMPYALFDLPRFLDHFGFDLWAYRNGSDAESLITPGWPNLWRQLKSAAAANPWPVVLAAPFGLLALLRRRAFLPLAAAGLLIVYLQSNQRLNYHRNFLVLHVLAALGFGAAMAWLWPFFSAALARRLGVRPRRAAWSASALLALPLLAFAWRQWTAGRALGAEVETRVLAARQLERQALRAAGSPSAGPPSCACTRARWRASSAASASYPRSSCCAPSRSSTRWSCRPGSRRSTRDRSTPRR